ncbi:hypothetical protein [Streptomyces massasporeus]|uniref:hypothetical protein n=1 Tax=Streptomyces massasporeus TaxID=67324 RepID=UPI003F682C28
MLDAVRLGPADDVVWAVVWGVTVGIIVVPQQHRLIALSRWGLPRPNSGWWPPPP